MTRLGTLLGTERASSSENAADRWAARNGESDTRRRRIYAESAIGPEVLRRLPPTPNESLSSMIYHLKAAGVPVSWILTAVYENAYGIARAAAKGWQEQTETPQFVVEVENGTISRSELFWPQSDLAQQPDDKLWIQVPAGLSAFCESSVDLFHHALRQALIEKEYLIPRERWEQLYPASFLIYQRFAEFAEACEALDREAGEDLAFEERWIPFMDVPEGFVPAFRVEKRERQFGITSARPGTVDPTDGTCWKDEEQANIACRHLNSGWTWDEVQVLMTAEPVTPS